MRQRGFAWGNHHDGRYGVLAPPELAINMGDTVVWVNNDPFPHTVTSHAGRFDSKSIAPGESWRYKATRKGEYPCICTFRPTMKGMLRVK